MNQLPSIPPRDPGFQLSSPMSISASAAPPPRFRAKKYLYFLRRFWWIPLITLVVAVSAAMAHFLTLPPEFVSSAYLVKTENLKVSDDTGFTEDTETYFGTMRQVLQSDALRDMALQRMKTGGNNAILEKDGVDKDGNPLPVQISVSQSPGSAVFGIQAISANPAFTPAYLNALVDSYLDFKKEVRLSLSDVTLASIATQVARYGQDRKNDEAALAEYEQSNNLVVLEQENQVGGAYLAKLRTDLAGYQLQSNLLAAVALEKSTGLLQGSTNQADTLIEQLLGNSSSGTPTASSQDEDEYKQLESLKFERARLSKYLRPEHPKIVKLDEDIKNAENQISYDQQQNEQRIDAASQALQIRINKTQQAISNWEAKLNYDNVRISQANSLKDSIEGDQAPLEHLTALMENVDITRNIDQDTLTVLQHASDVSRSYEKLKGDLAKAIFGGLVVGLGIVLLIALRDDRFTTMVEVTERIGDSVVGQVPQIPQLNREGSRLLMMANGDDHHTYVESYRNLRSALLYLSVDGVRPKVLLITSAVPNEGKSTIASNLSCAMALGGARVLLVDGDLRKGCLHDLLGLESTPGLSDLLLSPGEADKFIQASPMPNLWFLARGSRPRNPGDLFLSHVFDDLLAALRERFDYVIIDSGPVFAADDTTTLAPKVDGTLFVVRSHFSRSGVVKEALELLYQRQATVLGLILNGTDASSRSYHYYKYSEYHSPKKTT